jgi:hypothetical protein
MKRVIKVVESMVQAIVPDTNKYYGIKLCSGGREKCFVTRDGYRCKEYRLLCPDEITEGNSVNFISEDKKNLYCLLNAVLQSNCGKVYEFDTAKELFTWLAE